MLKHYPRSIKSYESSKARLESDAKLVQENTKPNDKGFSPYAGGRQAVHREGGRWQSPVEWPVSG